MSLHSSLIEILACLRATQWHAWVTHWKSSGPNYYADHLLFQRIYEGTGGGPNINAQIDGLGERIVALYGSKGIDAEVIIGKAHKFIREIKGKEPISGSLYLEEKLLEALQKAISSLSDLSPSYSVNLDNYLRSLGDERSTVVYLLRQRSGGTELSGLYAGPSDLLPFLVIGLAGYAFVKTFNRRAMR